MITPATRIAGSFLWMAEAGTGECAWKTILRFVVLGTFLAAAFDMAMILFGVRGGLLGLWS